VAVTADDVAALAGVVGQAAAGRALAALARRPAHAVLVVGPDGTGTDRLARGYAAAVLCPNGGCGQCRVCRSALGGGHPDVTEVVRTGPSLRAEDARDAVAAAQRKPSQGVHQVVVVHDLHLGSAVVPVLLKTVEEPPPATVWVLTAESVPPDLATIASRCAQVTVRPVPDDEVAAWLEASGVDPERAAQAARQADGRPERAVVLAADPQLAERSALWRSLPERVDGTGATAATLAAAVAEAVDAAVAVLAARQQAELEALEAAAEGRERRAAAVRKPVEERHKRELRRWRTEEWRHGLATLAQVYRDRAVQAADGPGARLAARQALVAFGLVEAAARALVRNPNERLLAEALLVRLGRLS
jgi:DNA polymerase-3 subunit delta'